MRSRLSVTLRSPCAEGAAHPQRPAVPPRKCRDEPGGGGKGETAGGGSQSCEEPDGDPAPAGTGNLGAPIPQGGDAALGGVCPGVPAGLSPVPLAGGTRAGSPGTWQRSGCSSAITWEPSWSATARAPRASSPSPSGERLWDKRQEGQGSLQPPLWGPRHRATLVCAGEGVSALPCREGAAEPCPQQIQARPRTAPSPPSSPPQLRLHPRCFPLPAPLPRSGSLAGTALNTTLGVMTGLGPSCTHSPGTRPGGTRCPEHPHDFGIRSQGCTTGRACPGASHPFPAPAWGAGGGPRPAKHFLTLLILN